LESNYKTPESILIDHNASNMNAPFFVTPIPKLCLLYIATIGSYTLYWGYKQWASQRDNLGKKKISPLWRTIFLIFYTHSLRALIASRLTATHST